MEAGENVHEDFLIWNLKVIKVESPIMTITSWFPLLRYGATRRSPCQLCLCQTDDWTEAGTMDFI